MKIGLRTSGAGMVGPWFPQLLVAVGLAMAIGCGSTKTASKKDDFFTSGSREADQRASQRMARDEQLAGSGEGAGEKGVKKAVAAKQDAGNAPGNITNKAAQVEEKLALFDRLGGEAGISNIVADFTPRVLQDPRVNWERKGVKKGGFSLKRGESVAWEATPSNVARLKRHLLQFLTLATGGPAKYDGEEIKSTHADMHITNSEFDAAIGDMKASLDRLKLPNKEQKELLAIIESTRPQIVEKR